MKYLLFVGILIYMFLTTTVAVKIGIKEVGTYSSFILAILFFIKLIGDVNNLLIAKFNEEFRIILLALVIIVIKISLGQFIQIQSVLFFFLIPMILSIILGTENKSNKRVIQYLILVFFIVECFLAIYERVFFTNIFSEGAESFEYFGEDWNFRSTALLGHPLNNALCISTIMGFIVISSIKIHYKMLLLILGFISLLCFNARGATLIWICLAVIYIISLVTAKKTKNGIRFLLLVFLLASAYFISLAVVNYGLGGRLVNEKISGESSQARVDVFKAFTYIDENEFWLGNSEKYLPIMHKLGAGGIENSYIVFIINYGIVLFIFLCIAYYFWFKRFLKLYTLFNKFIILSSFLLVGSTNNGLIDSEPWGFLILGFYCFPIIEKKQKNNRFFNRNKIISVERESLLVSEVSSDPLINNTL
ncbi:hypothetical protein [Flavobacterium sp. WC2509]|uniref:hypothetical protein n=1 Tax=Flavobacterium sp. WC2509 TaxID=3461406 RepID=UPI004044999D